MINWPILTHKDHILSYQGINHKDQLKEHNMKEYNSKDDEIETILNKLSISKNNKGKNNKNDNKNNKSSHVKNREQFRVVLGDYIDEDEVIHPLNDDDESVDMDDDFLFNDTKKYRRKNTKHSMYNNQKNNSYRMKSEQKSISEDLALMAQIGVVIEKSNQERRKEHVEIKRQYEIRRARLKQQGGGL
mmetsp:Transcript_26223/g.34106  ORF Transcript_26223/g.34106 Transcript_26223/m.34106 type:complete len:188 (+) Transcript_26223:1426-1989(+)